jgi:biopolymer transport protein ExbB
MKNTILIFVLLAWTGMPVHARQSASSEAPGDESAAGDESASVDASKPAAAVGSEPSFDEAAAGVQAKLADAVRELNELRETISAEKIPLSRRLSELEAELSAVREELKRTTRTADTRTQDVFNLQNEIKSRREEATYLSNLLNEYVRSFESRLHVAELHRYEQALEAATLALENTNLSEAQVYAAQIELLTASLERLHDALGGTRFEGTAVGPDGLVDEGTFVVVGPAAVFRPSDGGDVGTAEQRLGSLEPAELLFADPADSAAALAVLRDGEGLLPLDPTLGNAHKIEATRETFVEHVKKGGAVMYPIFGMAGIAFLIALYTFVSFLFLGRPSKKKVRALLAAVDRDDEEAAAQQAAGIRGPVGRMLAAGVAHLNEPRELIEEVMFETVLTTRLKLQRMLPFIAICAASAPLLGLLGTVTGIINTFRMITVFGSGDVKALSGGISEALITTKFGLIVAIPSLLLHAFLSRKARSVVAQMETSALAFVNQVSKGARHAEPVRASRNGTLADSAPSPELVRAQVSEILTEMLGSIVREAPDPAPAGPAAPKAPSASAARS